MVTLQVWLFSESLDIFLVFINVRGINERKKRKSIFNWVRKQNVDLALLQETYSSEKSENEWRCDWGGKVKFVHGTNHSRGNLILFSNSFRGEIIEEERDISGRVLFLKIKHEEEFVYVLNIYSPNLETQQIQFYRQLNRFMERKGLSSSDNIIIGGDWNTVLDTLDKKGGQDRLKEKVISEIHTLMDYFEINDIWRIKHPNKSQFTWRQKTPLIQCRLDYFLISSVLLDFVKDSSIISSVRSDHSGVFLSFHNIDSNVRGKRYWKFNSKLLSDENYTKKLKAKIQEWKSETINSKKLKWEYMKHKIRLFSIEYSKEKTKQVRTYEKQLLEKFSNLEKNLTNENLEEYETIKAELQAIDTERTEGLILRSRVRWYEQGEKSSKYFFNLEKRNNARKSVNKLINNNGKVLTNQRDIREEQKSFYHNLYQKYETNNTYLDEFLRDDLPSLNNNQKIKCDKNITLEECKEALKTFSCNKSPGNDGLTIEFYRYFWDDISDTLIACFEEIHNSGSMGISHRQAVITLIDKKDKDRQYLKNWRPISLLNVDYKIISKVLALRLKDILPDIIHENQTGFVKGRYIGDNIRTVLDIMTLSKDKNIPGILLSVDFEKAFDSLDWEFLHLVLEKLNFGDYFRKWINIFYADIEACVMNNGNSSGYFKLGRGVRQGDPLSPYLFIIAIETFANAVRKNTNIKGFSYDNIEVKLIQFADDTNSILSDINSVQMFFDMLSKFENCSGLKVKKEKTEAMWIGSFRERNSKPLGFSWKKCMKILGIFVTYDEKELINKNFNDKIQAIKDNIAVWKSRNLSFIGKNLIIKSLLLSKFTYAASLLTVPKEVIKQVDYLTQQFVWNGKRAKIRKNILMNSYENGGQNFPDFGTMVLALKLKWIKRYVDNLVNHPWKLFADSLFNRYGGLNLILYCNYDICKLPDLKLPTFYIDILQLWSKIKSEQKEELVWNNKDILENGKSLFLKDFFEAEVWYFKDFFEVSNNEIRPFDFFVKLGVKKNNFIKYCAIVQQLRNKAVQNLNTGEGNETKRNLYVTLDGRQVDLQKICSKNVYQVLIKEKLQTYSRIKTSYAEKYDIEAEEWHFLYLNYRKNIISNHLKDFQYKILYGYLALNPLLHKMKVKNSSLCSFCKLYKETIPHIFYYCKYTKNLLESFEIWLEATNIFGFEINEKNIIFGIYEGCSNKDLINLLLLLLKYYIYRCRFDEMLPTFENLLKNIRWNYLVEKMVAENKGKSKQHDKKWNDIKDFL